eukprot:gene22341-biopygen23069
MADQASSHADTNRSGSPERERTEGTQAPKTGMEALLEQQSAIMALMMQQMKDLNAQVEVAEETAKKAVSQGSAHAETGDAESEAPKKPPYVLQVPGNLFPTRPATLETDVPQMHDLYNDKTTRRTLLQWRTWVSGSTAHNTLKGVFALLSNHYSMIQLRASMESDATTHGGAEAVRAKLAFIEEKVYAGTDGLVTDSVLTKWLKEFDTTKAKALVEHLGLEVDLKAGQFRLTPARPQKIHLQSKALLSEASRQRRWLPARKLAAFTGLCQSVYLAVPPARLYLRELHFVLSTKRRWGAKLTRQAWGDVEWWLRLPAQSRWNGRKIWRSPTRAKVHTDASLFAWGGVLNLKHAARRFWPDELRHLHITHLELEEVYKTVQSFLRELTGKAHGRRAAAHTPQTGLVRGCKVRVHWVLDDAWYTGSVGDMEPDGLTHITYEDGDEEDLDMSKERYEVVPAAAQEPQKQAGPPGRDWCDRGGVAHTSGAPVMLALIWMRRPLINTSEEQQRRHLTRSFGSLA